jgi:hypothetical protein
VGLPSESSIPFKPSHLSESIEQKPNDDDDDDFEDEEYGDDRENGDEAGEEDEFDQNAMSTSGKSDDRFLWIHKLQLDITEHQKTIDRMNRDAQDTLVQKNAYESKMRNLQTQVSMIAKERDEALRLIQEENRLAPAGGKGAKDARMGKTADVQSRYREKMKKLESELALYRKKCDEAVRANARSKNDQLTKQLNATIESLKGNV